jgi:thiazole/oxazole-forming peptide maturase SagC family component
VTVDGTADPAQVASLTGRDTAWLTDSLRFHETVERFRDWSGAVVVAVSRTVDPLAMRALNRICLELEVPWLHATVDGPFVFVGPIVLPGRTACYECLETRVMMNLRSSESYVRYKSALANREIRFGRIPLEPVLRSLLVSHTVLELVNFVLTGTARTVGKVLAVYLPTMEFSYNAVLRLPGCTACGAVLERDEEQLYFDIRGLFEGTAA